MPSKGYVDRIISQLRMHDAGESAPKGPEVAKAPSPPKKNYPRFTMSDQQLPGLKGRRMGDAVRVVLDARVRGVNQYGDEPPRYEMEIRRLACLDTPHDEGS